jgi:outer membrane protein OmpA-like peptidoglycan-associated protein
MAVVAGLMTGCAAGQQASGSTGDAPGTAGCLTSTTGAAPNSPVIAVVTDVTSNDQSPAFDTARTAAFSKVLSAAFAMHAIVLEAAMGSDPAYDKVGAVALAVGHGPNALYQQANVTCERRSLSKQFNQLADQSLPGPLDVITALRLLSEDLRGMPTRQVDVVLLTPAVSATAPFDLASTSTLEAGPDVVVTAMRRTHEISTCPRWHFYVAGAGLTKGVGVRGERFDELAGFWNRLVVGCGGDLRVFNTQLVNFPVPLQHPQPGSTWPGGPAGFSVSPLPSGGVKLTLQSDVTFAFGQATLRPAAVAGLTQALTMLTVNYPAARVSIVGYTDDVGTVPYNLELSKARAVSVADWLEARGVAERRLTVSGAGENDPVGNNSTAAGRQENRRVTITVDRHPPYAAQQ